jgi:hypothetical protein
MASTFVGKASQGPDRYICRLTKARARRSAPGPSKYASFEYARFEPLMSDPVPWRGQ